MPSPEGTGLGVRRHVPLLRACLWDRGPIWLSGSSKGPGLHIQLPQQHLPSVLSPREVRLCASHRWVCRASYLLTHRNQGHLSQALTVRRNFPVEWNTNP